MNESIGLHMIVKNEETTLGRCLNSVKGLWDQLVIADTGSTDDTRAIAFDYGAVVVDYEWNDDFSAARNYALSFLETEWTYWLDADDVVVGNPRNSVRSARWQYWLDPDGGFTYWRERLVPSTWKWTGRCHEVLIGPEPLVNDNSVVVIHSPPKTRSKANDRNLKILQRQQSEEGLGARELYYLARELRDLGRQDEAADIYMAASVIETWPDQQYSELLEAAQCFATYDKTQAIGALIQAIGLKPDWPHAYFGFAELAYYAQEWYECVAWCEVGRRLPVPETLLFVDHNFLRYNWIIWYVNGLWHLDRHDEARAWTKRALALNPADPWHQQNDAFFANPPGVPRR